MRNTRGNGLEKLAGSIKVQTYTEEDISRMSVDEKMAGILLNLGESFKLFKYKGLHSNFGGLFN